MIQPVFQHFKLFIESHQLFTVNNRLLVGVSGGIDSVVLCHLLNSCGYRFEIAHVNFQLRGQESVRDEVFVRDLAAALKVACHVKKTDTLNYALLNQLSVQVAARNLRYDWFNELVGESAFGAAPLDFIVTAHQANDNAETILMNIFRGTGFAGLRGILPLRQNIRRPLLFARREQILAFAAEAGIKWVEDSSNAEEKYSRNFLRHNILPQIQQQYPAIVGTLNESAIHARASELFLQNALSATLKKLVLINGHQQQLPVLRLQQLPGAAAVLFAWLQPFGFSPPQIAGVLALCQGQTGHYIDSASHRLLRNRNWLLLTPIEERAAGILVLETEAGEIKFGSETLQWQTFPNTNQPIAEDLSIAQVDAAGVKFPLILRPWKAGDYFYPLGMTKKKKIARFLIDIKLSRTAKEKVWVIETNQKIIWVVGYRIDNRFKITGNTKTILKMQVKTDL
jgi:tRNA(Ile)-lysidine synthase